jgi:hypothetical protein
MKELSTRLLVGALLLLAVSAEFFFYKAYAAPRSHAAAQLASLTELLTAQSNAKPLRPPADQKSSATVPELLARVQELALSSGISVSLVEPTPGNAEQFKMVVDATYGGFIRFLARFETLQVTVRGFELTPSERGGSLRIVMDFMHTTTASNIHPKVISEFETKLRSVRLFDPFHPESGPIAVIPGEDPDDLTWTFHLTSISEVGEERFATIDGRDYAAGDELEGRVISAIGADTVTLTEKDGDGERRLFLRFRNLLADRT